MTYAQLERWMYAKDYRTWIAHGIHGIWIPASYDLMGMGVGGGVVASNLVFAFREFEGIVKNFIAYRSPNTHSLDRAEARKLLIDGIMDFVGPLIGNALYLLTFA